MQYLASEIRKIDECAKETLQSKQIMEAKIGDCPRCGHPIMKRVAKNGSIFYGCADYPRCKLAIPSIVLNYKLPLSEIRRLLKKGSTRVLTGFYKEKGNEFSGIVYLDGYQVKFRTPNKEELSVGSCPICQKEVVDKHTFYGCTGYPTCQFTLPKVFFGKQLSTRDIQSILQLKPTKKIDGFQGKKGPFSAKLFYNLEQKRLQFLFS